MKLVSTRLNPTVWLLATLSLMLPKAFDCADNPLTAVFIAPNKDIGSLLKMRRR
jgi:hypothetical protein